MERSSYLWGMAGVGLMAFVVVAGCGSSGSISNTPQAVAADDTAGYAGPINPAAVTDVEFHPRDTYAKSSALDSIVFPSADGMTRGHAQRGLNLFVAPRLGPDDGAGPYFNQRQCLGCHMSILPGRVPLPVARARTEDAFTIFGDFNPGTGEFNPRADAGGPVLHKQQLPGYPPQQMPPPPSPPWVRVTGNRAGPPYIGRGLLEAVPDSEIEEMEDQAISQLRRPGIHNENRENLQFSAGSPVVRLSRFGLRAAGPSLLAFDTGGLEEEIGLTNPFAPQPNESTNTPHPAPNPEVGVQDVRDLRTLIRNIAPPALAPILPGSAEDRGRILFGADFSQPRGLATDRRLNCAGCHRPVMITGASPADVGASNLSNKRFFPFSDLLIHDMGAGDSDNTLPGQGKANGRQWRTAPLMGLGVIGPPFFHDGRVLASQPLASALMEAIQRHDNFGADVDSDAHDAAEAYRALPDTGQFSKADLVAFLEAL